MYKLDTIGQVSVTPTRRQEADTGEPPEAGRPAGLAHTLAKRSCFRQGEKVKVDTQRLSSDLHMPVGLADERALCRGTEGCSLSSCLPNSFSP